MEFSLLETMRLDAGHIIRRERHLARAAAAAAALGFAWDAAAVAAALDAEETAHTEGTWRTRLLVAPDGQPSAQSTVFAPDDARIWRVALAAEPVASDDPSLRIKTTRRDLYERAKAARPDVDDVLLWNERGEITESTIANVVAEIDRTRYTPPVSCGLLPGIFRAAVLDADMVAEGVMTTTDIRRATRLWLINSLREWMRATLVD